MTANGKAVSSRQAFKLHLRATDHDTMIQLEGFLDGDQSTGGLREPWPSVSTAISMSSATEGDQVTQLFSPLAASSKYATVRVESESILTHT